MWKIKNVFFFFFPCSTNGEKTTTLEQPHLNQDDVWVQSPVGLCCWFLSQLSIVWLFCCSLRRGIINVQCSFLGVYVKQRPRNELKSGVMLINVVSVVRTCANELFWGCSCRNGNVFAGCMCRYSYLILFPILRFPLWHGKYEQMCVHWLSEPRCASACV